MIGVWFLDECDYVAGESQAGVLEWYRRETGVVAETCVEADLDTKYSHVEETDFLVELPQISRGMPVPCVEVKTFRQEINSMLERGDTFPAILAQVDM